MSSMPEPFRFLSREEFADLTKDEKIAYLYVAAEIMMRDAPLVGVIPAPKNTLH